MVTISVLTLAAALVSSVAAVPEVYPEVIPGPGMPSLESLGLTSADLYKMTDQATLEDLEKRWQLHCNVNGIQTCNAADAQACVNFLNNKGTTPCVVSGDNVVFCTAGTCSIGGSNISGQGSVSSYCRDVACGAQQVVNSCNRNGQVEGDQAACGNGGLIATVANRNQF